MASWQRRISQRAQPPPTEDCLFSLCRPALGPSAPPLHSCPACYTARPASLGPPRATLRATHVTHRTDPARALQEPAFRVTTGSGWKEANGSGLRPQATRKHTGSAHTWVTLGVTGRQGEASTTGLRLRHVGNPRERGGEAGHQRAALLSRVLRTRLRRRCLSPPPQHPCARGVVPPGDLAEPHLGTPFPSVPDPRVSPVLQGH